MPAPALAAIRPKPPPAARRRAEQPGDAPRGVRRLLAAFEFVESLPVLGESQARAAAAIARGGPGVRSDLVTLIERDVSLCVHVLRTAATPRKRRSRPAVDVLGAIDLLGEERVGELVAAQAAYSPIEAHPVLGFELERLRVHAMDVHTITAALARLAGHRDAAVLATAALLHDVGKLAMAHAYPGYPDRIHPAGMLPQARVEAERRKFGLDHATIGGVLVRRWGLAAGIAELVSSHHSDAPAATLLRLADTLAHHRQAPTVTQRELAEQCELAGVAVEQVETLLYEQASDTPRRALRAPPSSPLSRKEHLVVAELATGHSYKAIAMSMGLTVSTVRTHLHNIYRKIGVTDRAQAVLYAVQLGWVDAPQLSDAMTRSAGEHPAPL
jgi:putative nucleotidyltransferase with HDIG domain